MDYNKFYAQLFQPIEDRIGPIDAATLMAIIGFDCGGPLNLSTVGRGREEFVTYISCELAVTAGQKSGSTGPFEVMMICDDEDWTREILTKVGRMSFNSMFEHGHTIDIGQIVKSDCPVRGLIVEEFARVTIDGRGYGILCFHGVTQSELKYAMDFGVDKLIERRKQNGIYPRTNVRKDSIKAAA